MYYMKKAEKLCEIMNIQSGDVVSVAGSGGKTTLCITLCRELIEKLLENPLVMPNLNRKKVFFTTTTKIFPPDKTYGFYDLTRSESIGDILEGIRDKSGIFVLGIRKEVENTNVVNKIKEVGNISKNKTRKDDKTDIVHPYKISSLKMEEITLLQKYCDYMIIECDGSKMKPLKGWRGMEPVYVKETTKSIGVVPINVIGQKLEEELVHRTELFLAITGANLGETVKIETLYNLIVHKEGLFKGAIGEKILLINCADDAKDMGNVLKLGKMLKKGGTEIKIVAASLKNAKYYWLEKIKLSETENLKRTGEIKNEDRCSNYGIRCFKKNGEK